ncbi:hypothetical protein ACSFCN_05010 [Enterococcus faecalis]
MVKKGGVKMEYLGNTEGNANIKPRFCGINLCGVNGNCLINLG